MDPEPFVQVFILYVKAEFTDFTFYTWECFYANAALSVATDGCHHDNQSSFVCGWGRRKPMKDCVVHW